MKKVIGMLVALALFGALPAVASAQGTSPSSGSGTVSSGNTQTGSVTQGAGSGSYGTGSGSGYGHSGGNAGNQACLIQQNAGRDANAACSQTQNFGSSSGYAHRSYGYNRVSGVGTVGVQGVQLARTGFDAWVLALVGGLAVAGGLGLIAAQRRGRLTA